MSLVSFDNDFDTALDAWNNRMEKMFRNWESHMPVSPPVTKNMNSLSFSPALDVHDSDKEVTVQAELPGMKKDQIKIELNGQQLVISGENKEETKKEENGWKLRERSYGKFERRVLLPKEIDHEKVSAKFENGVLEVRVQKTSDAQNDKKTIVIR